MRVNMRRAIYSSNINTTNYYLIYTYKHKIQIRVKIIQINRVINRKSLMNQTRNNLSKYAN